MFAGLLVLAELIVFVLVAAWIGVGWTILATLATSAIGVALLGRPASSAPWSGCSACCRPPAGSCGAH